MWVDALYEKVRVDARIVSMAVLIVAVWTKNGHRNIIAVEPMTEESRSSYGVLFQNLKDRGLSTPRLIISDAHSGLVFKSVSPFPAPRGSVVGIFPNESSYVRLVTTYLMEYAEDWSVSRTYISHESIAATLLVAA